MSLLLRKPYFLLILNQLFLGVGCLGLIQPLYLVMTPELFPLSKDMYLISLSENQNFPFLVLSINVTRMSLHALRDGLLNR